MSLADISALAQIAGAIGVIASLGEDFQAHVRVIMTRTPDPRAKAFGVVPVTHLTSSKGK